MVCSCIITFVLSILKTVLLLLFWLRFLGRHPCVPCWPCPRSAGGLVLHTWLAPQAWLSLLGFDAALYKVSGQRSLCPHVAHISYPPRLSPQGVGLQGVGRAAASPIMHLCRPGFSCPGAVKKQPGDIVDLPRLTWSWPLHSREWSACHVLRPVLKAWKNDVSCSLWGLGLVYCDWIREPNEYRFAAEHKHNFMFSDAHILVR